MCWLLCAKLGVMGNLPPILGLEPDHQVTDSESQLPQLEKTINYNNITCFKLDWHLLNNFCMQE